MQAQGTNGPASERPIVGRDRKRQPRAWLRARVRLVPEVLVQAPPWVRGVFDHAWAPMEAMAQQVRCLPSALWDFLLSCDGGYVAISTEESRYVPGLAMLRGSPVRNVAYVSVEDLARNNERALHVLGHLVDHYLGCGGDPDGLWLSGGGGVTPDWQEAGARLQRLFDLGYGADEVAQSNLRDYFGQSLALYCRDRQVLNVADPQITKWLRGTLWNEAAWRTARRMASGT
jgi:hypothetical protein